MWCNNISFFFYFFIDHKKIEIIIQFQIPLFITKMVYRAFLRFINTGEIVEIESFFEQFLLMYLGFFLLVKVFQYSPVFSQDVIDVPDQVGVISVQLVVVCITAHIRAEFFIDSPVEFFAAFEALTFFHVVGF